MIDELIIPDVDIDVGDRSLALKSLDGFVIASQINDKHNLVPHNTGLYFQHVPIDPDTDISSFPYDIAEQQCGYYKIDIITNSVYSLIEDNDHLDRLLKQDINWSWFVNKLFFDNGNTNYELTHLSKYHTLCLKYPPKSVEDIAILIALIRPRKSYLMGNQWQYIKDNIWKKVENENGYYFKKSHAIAFAMLVTIHAKLIAEYFNI